MIRKHGFRSLLALAVAAGAFGLVAATRHDQESVRPVRPHGVYKAYQSDAVPVSSKPAVAAGSQSPDVITPKGSGTVGPSPDPASASFEGSDVDANTGSAADADCNAPESLPNFAGQCDDFFLTVNVSDRYGAGTLTVGLTFTSAEDYDVHVYDKSGAEVASSTGTNTQQESTTIPCPSLARSPYKIRIVYFQTFVDSQTYHTTATYNAGSPCPAPPVPTYSSKSLAFAPGTVVSAHFLGAEPQTTMERTNAPWVPQGNPGGISNDRIFVDWPLSSRSNIGQLSRSTDGGDSFRLLVDQTCAARSRPNCATGGGGDTDSDVNLANGTVLFADQEVLANEASATSTTHGDSFLLQDPISSTATATDRQWLAATDDTQKIGGVGPNIESFFTYHVPPTAYIHAIPDTTHLPVPQPAAQLIDVSQSGQPKVDNNPSSPGHGWIYYPFNNFILSSGTSVATAPSSQYADPRAWHPHLVSASSATSFPWLAIDSAGNAYMTWDAGGVVYYSFSVIANPLNNPQAVPPGVPGTFWSPPIRVTPPGVTSAVFPEAISGGDPGRLAVTYMGTTEYAGEPDGAGTGVHWNVYAAVITGATTSSPTVNTGIVSHRFVHVGNICTSGTFCGIAPLGDPNRDDRSLADMIDLGFDNTGRLGVVFEDNNTASFQDKPRGGDTDPEDFSAFDYFAKQVSGPSMFAATSPVHVSIPRDARADAAGDATFPNTAAGTNIPALDIGGASLGLVGSNLVAHVKLADATPTAMTGAITAYNLGAGTQPAVRLQYVVRFNTANETYHLSYEVLPTGATRAFGGKLNTNPTTPGVDPGDDGIVNPGSPNTVIAAGYHTDAGFTVSATVTPGPNGEIVLSAPASEFGLAAGAELYSVTAFATAGPPEPVEQSQEGMPQTALTVMRTVDASPPFDTTLKKAR